MDIAYQNYLTSSKDENMGPRMQASGTAGT